MEEVSEMNRNNFQFSILLVDQVTILAHRGYALLTSLRLPVLYNCGVVRCGVVFVYIYVFDVSTNG